MTMIRKAWAAVLIVGVVALAALPARAQNTTVRLTGSPPASMQFGGYTMPLCANQGISSLPSGDGEVFQCDAEGRLLVDAGGGGGSVTIAPPTLTYAAPDTASIGTTSTALATAAQYKTLQICTLPASTTNVWLNLRGAAAVASAGVPVLAAGNCTNLGTQALPMPTTAINAITDGVTAQTVTLAGG